MKILDLERDLYSYQIEDSNTMMSEGNWLNFSEMGVGKTPEALRVIETGGYKYPLIFCPNSLKLEWRRQIGEWVGDNLTAVATSDSYTKLLPLLNSFSLGQKFNILNYEVLRNTSFVEMLSSIKFDCIVFDEAHKLRNPDTKVVQGLWKFLKTQPNAKCIVMSGSPIMNYPNDLYVPLSIVDPSRWPRTKDSYREYMYKYCYWTEGRYGSYIYGSRNLDELKARTKDLIVRRTKKEVLPFLPDKSYRRVELDMTGEQRSLYDSMERDLRVLLDTGETLTSPCIVALLTRLRQINLDPKIVGVTCPSAKTNFLVDLIEGTNEKLVIFSTFEKYVYLLSLMYPKDSVFVAGTVKPDERAERVREFQTDESKKLFLGTIQTAGEGITLTSASNVVLMDRWWNEPTNQQAIDRCHRIGQKDPVQVIYPICENSIDSTLDEVLSRKSEASSDYYNEGPVKEEIFRRRFTST